jgi:hypothetical protein
VALARPVTLPIFVDFIHDGVPLDELNVDGRYLRESIKQHSHIRLTPAEYEAAVEQLAMAAKRDLVSEPNRA